jgi:WD40 repeat protein
MNSLTALANDNLNLYASDDVGRIISWKKHELYTYKQVPSHSTTYLQSLHVDNDYLFGGTTWNDCSIRIYEKSNLELKHTLEGPLGTVFVFASDDDYLFSGSGDSRVIIWNKKDWSEAGFVSGQRHFILSLAIDEDYIFAGGIDDCTNVFARDDLSQVASLEGHDSNVLSLTCDDAYLYSGSGELWWGGPGSPRPPEFESAVRVWDKKDWSCVAVLQGHSDNVNAIATDHEFVYSISDDATFRVYSKDDWSEKLCIEVDVVRIDAMTTDENFVYLGCSDGSVRRFPKSDLRF